MKIERTVNKHGHVRWNVTHADRSEVNATWIPELEFLYLELFGPRGGAQGRNYLPMNVLKELAEEIRKNED